jgi:hypothetical protein
MYKRTLQFIRLLQEHEEKSTEILMGRLIKFVGLSRLRQLSALWGFNRVLIFKVCVLDSLFITFQGKIP